MCFYVHACALINEKEKQLLQTNECCLKEKRKKKNMDFTDAQHDKIMICINIECH